jgi:putative endonuclease
MDEDNVIHFVEVRTLTAPSLLKPYETVGIAKQRNLIRAASSYLAKKRVRKEVSFDIVSVLFNNGRAEIEYFPNAFSPRW